MSNLVKSSGRFGPGFDTSALFGDVFQIQVTIDPRVPKLLRPLEQVAFQLNTSALNAGNFFYQESVLEFNAPKTNMAENNVFYNSNVLTFDIEKSQISAVVGSAREFTLDFNLS